MLRDDEDGMIKRGEMGQVRFLETSQKWSTTPGALSDPGPLAQLYTCRPSWVRCSARELRFDVVPGPASSDKNQCQGKKDDENHGTITKGTRRNSKEDEVFSYNNEANDAGSWMGTDWKRRVFCMFRRIHVCKSSDEEYHRDCFQSTYY